VGNCRSGADHCLDVLSCSGAAVVIGDGVEVSEDARTDAVRRPARDQKHGGGPLKTLDVYVPPAYAEGGEELSAGKA
jgi:hypothetical protein